MNRSKCISSGGKRSTIILKGSVSALALVAGLSAGQAKAALILTLSEPGYAPVTGVVSGNTDSFIGSYGDFTTNIVIGFTNSGTPSPLAELQVQSLDVTKNSTSAAEVLTITTTDTDFTFPGVLGSPLALTSSLGGTITSSRPGDSVTFQSTATPSTGSPVTTGVQTFVTPATPPGLISFAVPPATNTFVQTGSYGLTNQIVASLSDPNEDANLSGTTTVAVAPVPIPEPMGLSVIAVSGLALLSRRRLLA